MSLTNQALFEKGRPISSLFPIFADSGIVIERQQNFRCTECDAAIPGLNVRGFIINKDDTLVSHLFCQCSNCEHMSIFSDVYEERMFGIALGKKMGQPGFTHKI